MTNLVSRWLPAACLCTASLWGQSAPSSADLLTRLQAAERQIDEDHAELQQLRRQLEALQSQVSPAAALQQAVAGLEEQQAVHQAEIQVHEQEKVETVSKYSVKLHGLVLFNAAVTNGAVDQPLLPILAVTPGGTAANGSLNATGRQTMLGLEATGPELWGAHTYANVDMDFSAGLSPYGYVPDDIRFRLRTATAEIAWPNTTVQGGIAPLILSPQYATSYSSVAEPPLAWSGALWSWLPQISVEHRFPLSDRQRLSLQAALADIPDAGNYAANGLGAVSAAEASRYPGSEVRAAWNRGLHESIGVGGYWSPHTYSGLGTIDAWAGTLDWLVPLPGRLQVSGQAYRGSALGGLSAGAFKDGIQFYSSSLVEPLAGLQDAGGWSQLKFTPLHRVEFNVAFGLDSANNRQLRNADLDDTDPFTQLARNQTVFGNIIFRPTSTIILSGEYRHIRSWPTFGPAANASRFGLAAGYAF